MKRREFLIGIVALVLVSAPYPVLAADACDEMVDDVENLYACPCCGDGQMLSDEGEPADCPFNHYVNGDGVTAAQHDAFYVALKRLSLETPYREYEAVMLALA